MKTTIAGAKSLHVKPFLAGGDTRFGYPPFEAFSKNTVQDVISWAGKALKEEQLEVSVVGDFDPDTVIQRCSLYLGGLDKRKPYTNYQTGKRLPVFPHGKNLSLTVKTQIPKSLIIVTQPA